MKILVVDDDLELLGLIGFALRQAGYLVLEASDGPLALKVLREERPDLAILDVNLPRMSGFDLLKKIRETGGAIPVMMLTVRSAEEDQVEALDLGADDYLTKPFSPRTLLARVRALLRRVGTERPQPLVAGNLALDAERHAVTVGSSAPTPLTKLEFRLLQLLVANAGHPVGTERIISHVWGYRGMGDRQLLKQLVHRLRQKIERDPSEPRYLLTVPGVGYQLREVAASEGEE